MGMRNRRKTDVKSGSSCPVIMDDTGEPCGRPVRSAGLCPLHYRRKQNGVPPMGSAMQRQATGDSWRLYESLNETIARANARAMFPGD